MKLGICSLASGSSGNCYLVKSAKTAVLVDAGISARQIKQKLATLGMGLDDISAVLITHEHSDHIKSLPVLCKGAGFKLIASEGTLNAIKDVCAYQKQSFNPVDWGGETQCFCPGDSFQIGDIEIRSYPLSHDAAQPAGYMFSREGASIAIVTDTGVMTDEILGRICGCDLFVLESNHDESMLRVGPYPWFLKQRILSDRGHLSNEAAAKALVNILQAENAERGRTVLLAHLSKENNFPQMALATVNNILEQEGFEPGRSAEIYTLSREEISPMYTV